MIKISELTTKVRKWNMMGHSLLPELEIVIITGSSFEAKLREILTLFGAIQMQFLESQQSHHVHRIFVMNDKFYGRIHVLMGLSDSEIKDYEFRERKKKIEEFRRKKDSIFITFSEQDIKQLQKNQIHLIQFGLGRSIDKVILFNNFSNETILVQEILTKYQDNFRYDLATNYKLMKQQRKQYEKLCQRYIQWKKVLNQETNSTTFSLMGLKFYTDSMVCSFLGISYFYSGTYSSSNFFSILGIQKSINWKVMQLLHAFWEIESDLLFKEVDSFKLSYIEQQYKMSDHYSIGGFLPDTCFKAIFSPPLYEFRDALMGVIQNIKQSVLRHVELALKYCFENTNVEQKLIEKELESIQKICDKFIDELSSSLESQIEFIHANPEDFWNYRQLNSSFYSPEQQVYIQIKYIGKAYVRKVYESIKDSVPRFVGQNLLKKIVKHINENSLNTFIEITKNEQFQVVLSSQQIQKYEANFQTLKDLNSLVSFFSLKISSSLFIKNFHEKQKKDWDRMFGKKNEIQVPQPEEEFVEERGGLINWMRNIFKRNPQKKQIRRANSGEKTTIKTAIKTIQNEENSKKMQQQKALVINQKHWLLIINTNRQISPLKLKQSAAQGFPVRFRASIWLYLSTSKKAKIPSLKSLLTQSPTAITVSQIQKDIPRTSPKQLFQYSLKNSLKNILVGYSIYDKQLQYTQGMNFIVAVILGTITNYGEKISPLIDHKVNYEQIQQKGFRILRHLMEQCGVRKVMMIEPGLLTDLSLRLHDLIGELSPRMLQIIQQTPFNCEMIFSSPLLSCLTNVSSNFSLLRRFMDMLITHDFLIVYKIIAQFVASCQGLKKDWNKSEGDGDLYGFLKGHVYDKVYDVVGQQGLSRMLSSI